MRRLAAEGKTNLPKPHRPPFAPRLFERPKKMLCNDCDGVEPEVEGGGGITGAPAEQGNPLIEFLPIVGVSVVVGSAGEAGYGISAQYRIGGISAPRRITRILRERNRNGCR